MASYIIINLDKTPANVFMYPPAGATGPIPFNIYLTSNEYATVYYTLDGSVPVIGGPNTLSGSIPFQITISTVGVHYIRFFTVDSVGNQSILKWVAYTSFPQQVGHSYVIINLDKTPPNIGVSPASNTMGRTPFTIYFASDEYATVYYTLNGSTPVPGNAGTFEGTVPFQHIINEMGNYRVNYYGIDDVGNPSTIKSVVYYVTHGLAIYDINPKIGYTVGGTVVTVTGESINFGSTILIDGEAIPTTYGGQHKKLIGKTLPKAEGTYNVQIDDPIQGLSSILMDAFTFIEPALEPKIIETEMVIGEIRKSLFDTDEGPMILERKLVENFDIEDMLEGLIKDSSVKEQINNTKNAFPSKVVLE